PVEIDRAAVVPCAGPPDACMGRAPVAAAAAVPRPNNATVAAVAALAVRTLESMVFLLERKAVAAGATGGTRAFDTIAAAIDATEPSPASSLGDPGAWADLTSDARRA